MQRSSFFCGSLPLFIFHNCSSYIDVPFLSNLVITVGKWLAYDISFPVLCFHVCLSLSSNVYSIKQGVVLNVLFHDICFLLYYLCVYYLHVTIDFVHHPFISGYLQKFALANKEDLYDMLFFIRLGIFCKNKRNRHAVPIRYKYFLVIP